MARQAPAEVIKLVALEEVYGTTKELNELSNSFKQNYGVICGNVF